LFISIERQVPSMPLRPLNGTAWWFPVRQLPARSMAKAAVPID